MSDEREGTENWLRFILLRPFDEGWKDLRLKDIDLQELEKLIAQDPKQAPVVAGTDGLRKIRFAPSRWRRGQSGAIRVGYVYFPEYRAILLMIAYAKNEKDDIDANEKKAIRNLIRRIRAEFAKRLIR